MSGLALFGLKSASLVQFDQRLEDQVIKYNLQTLYGIEQAPSDTYKRERLDKVDSNFFTLLFQPYFLSFKEER